MRRSKTFLLGFLLVIAGCGSGPQPGLAPEIPPGTMARSDARETASDGVKEQRGAGRYDLSRDEERGGHTLDKHVGRSDEELRQRLERERSISAASTWTDRAAAEETSSVR
jgi:hypothetical protein